MSAPTNGFFPPSTSTINATTTAAAAPSQPSRSPLPHEQSGTAVAAHRSTSASVSSNDTCEAAWQAAEPLSAASSDTANHAVETADAPGVTALRDSQVHSRPVAQDMNRPSNDSVSVSRPTAGFHSGLSTPREEALATPARNALEEEAGGNQASKIEEGDDLTREATSTAPLTSAPSPPSPLPPSATQPPSSSSPLSPFTDSNMSTAEAAIRKWKESRDYLRLQRELNKILSAMDRTSLTDWAAQASLLSQLHKTVQAFKDVIGAVELPDGAHVAKSLWRVLSPQSVVGVQRKALEVLLCYVDFVNPAYPMTKDLPLFLPALLELLPQATMQVKSDVVELLDRGVVRRMPPTALRSTAEGVFAALLSCLEESETSPMYRRAMALIEYMHTTLQREDAATVAVHRVLSSPLYAAELRGGQVLPAYAWLLIRDAAALRLPALNVIKNFITQGSRVSAQADLSSGVTDRTPRSLDRQGTAPRATACSCCVRPDWIGGDMETVVSALLNSLQDTQEKTHRLALDVLALICPLSGGNGGAGGSERGGGCAYRAAVAVDNYEELHMASSALSGRDKAEATGVESSVAVSGAPFSPHSHTGFFPFETRSLLAAAAVQLLGTRYGTPSVTRRIFQWLIVDPGRDSSDHRQRPDVDYQGCAGAVDAVATAGGDAASSSSNAYVRDVTSYILAQGVHMVVQHWELTWVSPSAQRHHGSESQSGVQPPSLQELPSELSALSHTARSLMYNAAPRLSSATSIAAALGGVGGGGGSSGDGGSAVPSATASAAAAALATPLVWLRALLLLFRYRSPSCASSPVTLVSPRFSGNADGAAESSAANSPFLLFVAPLVLPSLSRLLVEVPLVLARLSSSVQGGGAGAAGGSPDEEMWTAEVRELLRVVPWTSFVRLDQATVGAAEKLVRPLLSRALDTAQESAGATAAAATEQLQCRVLQCVDQASAVADALEPPFIYATAEQPLAAQEYVRASLDWSDAVAHLLGDVLDALAAVIVGKSKVTTQGRVMGSDGKGGQLSYLPLLVSTANGLLRLLVQRTQQLMEPMLDAILATAAATDSAVVDAGFFSSFLSSVDTRVLCQLRQATLRATTSITVDHHATTEEGAVPSLSALPAVYSVEVQKLLSRMHLTTLRFTSFLAQLHLRCRQQAVIGVLLDSAPEESAGAREQELTRQTTMWLENLCSAAVCAAAACGGVEAGAASTSPFFARTVRLVLDILFRARGSLLPESAYHTLEPGCPVSGGLVETVSFTETYILAPVVRCLWEGYKVRRSDTAADALNHAATKLPDSTFFTSTDSATFCRESLLLLIAVSPPCARCLDVYILQSPLDTSVVRLVELHRQLTEMRAQQRRDRLFSPAASESAALSELQDPGVLFLGLLTVLGCLSNASECYGSSYDVTINAAESTRQLARAYLSQALVRDLPGVLLPLFFSFLCPLVLPSAPLLSPQDGGASSSGGVASLQRSPAPAFSALPLTVLLPTTRRNSAASLAGRPGDGAKTGKAERQTDTSAFFPIESARVYRNLEAPELVAHLFALLQLPTATEWVRQAMQASTPNSLRVLLRGLEAQSFTAPESRAAQSCSASPTSSATTTNTHNTASSAAAAAREGPSDTLFAATALLLLNLCRQSLLSLHWLCMRQRDHASETRRGHSNPSLESLQRQEPLEHRHRSTLLDSLACLNRLLELSQTGLRMQPHRTAVLVWRFTSAQLLPLLRLAVQADLHAAQAMLLDHIRNVVLYLDDSASSTAETVGKAGRKESGSDGGFASRHWRQHTLLRIGVAAAGETDRLLTGAAAPESCHMGPGMTVQETDKPIAASPQTDGPERVSATPALDELQLVPPAVLSNKLLYAMIGEVVEHVVGNTCAPDAEASICAHEVDTLVQWLRFYCDVMPYLYRDLVASAEVMVDVLLSALESTQPYASASPSSAIHARVQCVCYATLTNIVCFLLNVARTADVENYETAVRMKESMSWIASTFTQDDPVAQARSSTMWARSSVLTPLRDFLSRLVSAPLQCLRLCDALQSTARTAATNGDAAEGTRWGYDASEDEDVAMGWKSRSLAAKQPAASGSTTDLREYARRFLRLLNHAAGPKFLAACVDHWCYVHATQSLPSSLWMFETAAQRQCRLRQQRRQRPCDRQPLRVSSATVRADDASDETTIRLAAWAASEEAQRAAYTLLEDVGVSVVDVTAVLARLLRDAVTSQQRAEQQQQQAKAGSTRAAGPSSNDNSSNRRTESPSLSPSSLPPPRVTQMLYFLNKLIEALCVRRQGGAGGTGGGGGGLTQLEAEAVLATVAEVVSQWPPDPLSFCCLLHTLYCVVSYAKDESAAAQSAVSGKGNRGNFSGSGAGSFTSGASLPTAPVLPFTAVEVYQNKDYSFALCRLLEGLSLNPAMTHRSAALLLLQLLSETFYAVLPSSLRVIDNPGRVVDAATHVFHRTLLPALRRGIASVSEAEILISAPLVNASLRVLRATIHGFAPDLTFEKRVQRDVMTLFFAEYFFRNSRSALHEWALLLRQMCAMDHEFYSVLCERIVPSPGRLSAMMMSRETEALLRARAMKSLAFYVYAVMVSDETAAPLSAAFSSFAAPAPTAMMMGMAAPASAMAGGAFIGGGGAASSLGTGSGTGPGATMTMRRHKELTHLLREQLTYTLQHFTLAAAPTVLQVEKKEVFLQPLCAAFLVFRVLLMSTAPESLVAELWPLVWPELLQALSIVVPTVPAGNTAAALSGGSGADKEAKEKEAASQSISTEALQEVLQLQMEALKVLDVDYTLYPAHAFAFRWLFTDDAAFTNLLALQQEQQWRQGNRSASHAPSPLSLLQRTAQVRRPPLVSHLEVLRLLKSGPQAAVTSEAYLSCSALVNAVHEQREDEDVGDAPGGFAPVLSTIQRWWPPCARPSAADCGLRRPLYSIPRAHYPRLDGVYRAAQAFTVFLQRVNSDVLSVVGPPEVRDAQKLKLLQAELRHCVGHHNEVDMVYMQDLVEADFTTTDPDTML